MLRLLLALLLALWLGGCVRYEFDHELWLRVDGSGSVQVTGRPGLWTAFKGLSPSDADSLSKAARESFERSGLRVTRVRLVRRAGRPYLFVAADFDDVNRLAGTPAFPDLKISMSRSSDRLRLEGAWSRPHGFPAPPESDSEGLVAVRFHLPSKVYDHKHTVAGVERGNILSWREDTGRALAGNGLVFAASLDSRSILSSTLGLLVAAIVAGLTLLAGALYAVARRGRRSVSTTTRAS